MALDLSVAACLPEDYEQAVLVGRAWVPDTPPGPAVITIRGDDVVDLSAHAPTVAEFLDREDRVSLAKTAEGPVVGSLAAVLANSAHDAKDPDSPHFLAPVDLQPVKACGVTFAASMLERVIEEKAKGDPSAAEEIRAMIMADIGTDLSIIVPGSQEAMAVKAMLIEKEMWSAYLEVGIGPDPEVFTKAQPMSAVGLGAEVGVNGVSTWNNPEPEITLIVNGAGDIVGATLGNDVNLRDVEGRSALLLGMAKDNNASAAVGPFIRLFDDGFGMDDVRTAELTLRVEGLDQFVLHGKSSMSKISRDPVALVDATCGTHHQYPDGFALMTGTLFAPTQDRDTPGEGFTHKVGDVVTISTPRLGSLINRVNTADQCPPWAFGTGALMRNLSARGLLKD